MATIPYSLLLIASSPYAKKGILYTNYQKYFGKDDAPVLVWQGATEEMNSTLVGDSLISEMRIEDPERASAEFDACFRSDVTSLVSPEVVSSLVVQGVTELPPADGVTYVAFCDPAGGSGQDSMTMAIAHMERDVAVLDRLVEVRPPFSPDDTCATFCGVLARYFLNEITGDKWGAEFTRERFETRAVTYNHSDKPKSDLYRELLPLLKAGA